MRKNLLAAVLVTAIVVASWALTAYWLDASSSRDFSVEGGVILSESDGMLTVWSYKPEVRVGFPDFDGTVLVRNCVSDATVEGVGDFERIGNTTITFDANGIDEEVIIAPPSKAKFTFAVMGDSHGHNYVLSEILSRLKGCEFALICGDVTPSGAAEEFNGFWETIAQSPVPVYCTMGNHDAKNGGASEYAARFGSSQYSFDYTDVRFTVIDSSDLNISKDDVTWVRETLEGAMSKVMLTHAPAYDPFGGDHILHPDSCDRVVTLAKYEGIDAVFAGHIHAFNRTTVSGTDFIISGGAGTTMIDGERHFVNVTVDKSGAFSFDRQVVVVDDPSMPHVNLIGREGNSTNLTVGDLMAMPRQNGLSAFENYYGNIGGQGNYSGVTIDDLIACVGGMEVGDLLRVTAVDGYRQDFGYLNVYPNDIWLDLQGSMILALSMDSVVVPDWQDGPKLLMLAPDGLYSNSDCEATSYDGQGYSVYPSAGARWVKNVATIRVMPCS
ncbi:MAG: metallophosphoesterase [Methanobacteriota archaeon]|nr:MAG: metallophosphoesterase [Euryarchaeota archaeon]